jgi:hypothetical protein
MDGLGQNSFVTLHTPQIWPTSMDSDQWLQVSRWEPTSTQLLRTSLECELD